MARSKGRSGRPWRRMHARVIAEETHCARCGGWVDKRLRFPHPYSASVDHTTPLGAGGAPLARANLRLMHFGCNSSKRDGRRPKPRPRTSRDW